MMMAVTVAGARNRRLPQGSPARAVREGQPGAGFRLLHAALRVIADTGWEGGLQPRPLLVGEGHVVIDPAERLELALQHVVRDRAASGHADQPGVGEELVADGSRGPLVLYAVDEAGVEYEWTAGSICDQLFTYTGLIRMTAGGPVTNDVLKCQLKPLSRVDYNVAFTDEQW